MTTANLQSPAAIFSWKYPVATLRMAMARMWTGSVLYARRAGMHTVLVADQPGIDLLVHGLQIPFDEVLLLPFIPDELRHVWDLTKVTALLTFLEKHPTGFASFHVDHDVFLRRPLPKRILTAPFAGERRYVPDPSAAALNFSLPVPRFTTMPTGVSSGIFGGVSTDRIAATCRSSLATALDPRNRERLTHCRNGWLASTIFGELSFGESFPDAELLFPNWTGSQPEFYRLGYIHATNMKDDAGRVGEMMEFFRSEFPDEYAAVLPRWDGCWPSLDT